MTNFFKKVIYGLFYYNETRKNFYPCRLTGCYKKDKDGRLVLEIKNFGNGKTFFLTLKNLFEDSALLSKSSSHDVSRISFLAAGELAGTLGSISDLQELAIKSLEELKKD